MVRHSKAAAVAKAQESARRAGKSMPSAAKIPMKSPRKAIPESEEQGTKKRRMARGRRAVSDARRFGRMQSCLTQALPFQRLVKDIAWGVEDRKRFRKGSLKALQKGTERLLVKIISYGSAATDLRDRMIVQPKDVAHTLNVMGYDGAKYLKIANRIARELAEAAEAK